MESVLLGRLPLFYLPHPVRKEMYGLIFKAEQEGRLPELSLHCIDMAEDSPPYQLLEDHRHWLWTCQ